MIQFALVCGLAGIFRWGSLRGFGDDFAGAVDRYALLALVVEVDVENGGAAAVPDGFGDREVEEDHAFGGLAGGDHGFSEEGFGGEGFDGWKGGVDGGEVVLLCSAGGDLLAVGGGEGGCEVLEEERKAEAVVDAEGGEDVEIVLRWVAADEGGVGLEDGVGGEDMGADDGEVGGLVWGELNEQGDDDAKQQKRYKYRSEEIAADGLGEGELRHFGQDICLCNVTEE